MKTNIKKPIIAALCVCMLLGGCSSKSGDKGTGAPAKPEDNKEQITKYEEKIDKYEKQLDSLAGIISMQYGFNKDDLLNGTLNEMDIDGMVHAIYDDTAVIEAYKSGDASKLTDEKDKYILEQLKEVIKANIKEGMSDYEKEKAVYDYMFKHTMFDQSSLAAIPDSDNKYNYTPYGFFKYGDVICVGNATTFKLFMDALDIDCKIIHSTKNGEHAWNVVKINDNWYHVDVTFDQGESVPVYNYFNVPDSAKKYDSYPWDDEANKDIPECNSIADNPMCKEAVKIKDIYEFPALLAKKLKNNKKVCCAKIKLDKGINEGDAINQVSMLWEDISMGSDESSEISRIVPISVFSYDGYLIFGVRYMDEKELQVPDNDNQTNDENVLKIDAKKLSEAFSKAFTDGSITYYGDGSDYSQTSELIQAQRAYG